jgi:GTP pyrophosphokinase
VDLLGIGVEYTRWYFIKGREDMMKKYRVGKFKLKADIKKEEAEKDSLYEAALIYAAQAHKDQLRKGTAIPYITHPVMVAEIVRKHGGKKEQIAGALLHDVVEDRGGLTALGDIRTRFGETVGDIVLACSDSVEQPKPDWWTRKQQYIAHIATMRPEAMMVSLADKIHNGASIAGDLALVGEFVFKRFSAGKEGTLWYYRALVEAFRKRGHYLKLVNKLDQIVSRIEYEVKSRRQISYEIAANLFVKFLGKSSESGLLNGKIYCVQTIDMKGELYRIIDGSGEDYLYHKDNFEVVNVEVGDDPDNPAWARETWALMMVRSEAGELIAVPSEAELKRYCSQVGTSYEDLITFPIYKFRPWALKADAKL